jgi:hypothetical protein
MGSINDNKFNALRAQGFTGALPDMERAYWLAGGIGNTFIHSNDSRDTALAALGFSGALQDKEAAFWASGGGGGSVSPFAFTFGGQEYTFGGQPFTFGAP